MELIVFITQDHIHAGVFLVKLLCMLCMVGIIWASQDIAKSLKTSSLWALWCAGANPLMLLHLIGGMHNEALMVALMAIGLALVLRRKHVLGIAVPSSSGSGLRIFARMVKLSRKPPRKNKRMTAQ